MSRYGATAMDATADMIYDECQKAVGCLVSAQYTASDY